VAVMIMVVTMTMRALKLLTRRDQIKGSVILILLLELVKIVYYNASLYLLLSFRINVLFNTLIIKGLLEHYLSRKYYHLSSGHNLWKELESYKNSILYKGVVEKKSELARKKQKRIFFYLNHQKMK
jgi:hypothetical protein